MVDQQVHAFGNKRIVLRSRPLIPKDSEIVRNTTRCQTKVVIDYLAPKNDKAGGPGRIGDRSILCIDQVADRPWVGTVGSRRCGDAITILLRKIREQILALATE